MQDGEDLNESFKAINLIYGALGAGMLLTVGLFYYMVSSGLMTADAGMVPVLQIVVPVVAVSSFGLGKYLYGMFAAKSKADLKANDAQRLMHYRTASLISWATLEGSGLFAGVSYFITGDQIFLAFFALIFLGFIFSKPSIAKFQQDF